MPDSPCHGANDDTIGVSKLVTWSHRGDGRQGVLYIQNQGPLALKFFGRKRSSPQQAARQLGHWLLRRSGLSSRARYRTERSTLELWRREGFRVPRVLTFEAPKKLDLRCLALEWIEGPCMRDTIPSGPPSPATEALLRSFAADVARRHRRALETREPRLLHQHPTLIHVIVDGERFAFIDFEVVSVRRSGLPQQICNELFGWLRSIYQRSLSARSIEVFCDAYGDRERLEELANSRWLSILAWTERTRRDVLVSRPRPPKKAELLGILRSWCRHNRSSSSL